MHPVYYDHGLVFIITVRALSFPADLDKPSPEATNL